jgi:uncharacterized OsmC-like protein
MGICSLYLPDCLTKKKNIRMALSTIKVKTEVQQGFETKVSCGHDFVIDQPEAAGGKNAGPNPLDVFLSSLGGCICAVGKIISNQKKLGVRGISVEVNGEIDKDFLLGKTTDGRAGFTEITMLVDVDADMSVEEKQGFISEIQTRCPIADNIKNITRVTPNLK